MPRASPEAVVIGKGPNALGAIRSLAIALVPVALVSFDVADPVMRSRYAKHKHVFPGDIRAAGAEFCDFPEAHLLTGPVLIPTLDAQVQWMASQRARLRKSFRFCIPSAANNHRCIYSAIRDLLVTAHHRHELRHGNQRPIRLAKHL